MDGLQLSTDHIVIGGVGNTNGEVKLDDGYVIGISIENLNASQDNLMYGLNSEPTVTMEPGDPARLYGGFHACGVPCYYAGTLKWNFVSNNGPQGLIIITRLTSEQKSI